MAEAATYTIHKEHKRRTLMPSAGFEPGVPNMKLLHTYTLDPTTSDIVFEKAWTDENKFIAHNFEFGLRIQVKK